MCGFGESNFYIGAGTRQGRVLSPRLFRAMFADAMRERRQATEPLGVDWRDGLPPLLDIPFADDIRDLAYLAQVALQLLDALVESLRGVGLCLSLSRGKFLSTKTQPPQSLITAAGDELQVLG